MAIQALRFWLRCVLLWNDCFGSNPAVRKAQSTAVLLCW